MISLRRPAVDASSLEVAADAVGSYARRVLGEGNKSAAHNFGHLQRVARYAPLIVRAAGGSRRDEELARIGGYLHDLVRSPTQTVDDETLSAKKAEPVLRGMKKFTEEDIHTILAAVHSESMPKRLLGSGNKDYASCFRGRELVCLAVGLADRIEANGAYIIARRSQFVGGERFLYGDLGRLRRRLEEERHPFAREFDPRMAVLCESYIRLGMKNNQDFYPKWFLPVVRRLFFEQRSFYYALMASKGLMEADVARILIEIGFPAVTGHEIIEWERKRLDSGREVSAVTEEQIGAAVEVVAFFSAPEIASMDTAGAIGKFKTSNPVAARWHGEMMDYLRGGLAEQISNLRLRG